jgi:triosephosphate isomerase (TIM)
MRKIFVAGNWKMNTTKAEAAALVDGLKKSLGGSLAVEVAVCPPFCYLETAGNHLHGSPIKLGAQNVYFETKGAFTGEVSPAMLVDMGCTYVIIGHSERRHTIGKGECDAMINKKVHAALKAGLLPILAIGEKLEQRDGNQTEAVLTQQLQDGLAGLSAEQMAKITIAYEPVWAIGTGRTATPQQAQDAHVHIRKVVAGLFGQPAAVGMTIQYGGSMNAANAAELLSQKDVDGGLIGGASLKVEDFTRIVQAAVKAKAL